MNLIYTLVDYFEGLLRFVFFGLTIFGGVKLMGLSKTDPRLEGLKMAGMGVMLFAVTSLLGDMASSVGDWFGIPFSFLNGMLATVYGMLRQFMSGFIDVGAGVMFMMGLSKAAKAMAPPKQ